MCAGGIALNLFNVISAEEAISIVCANSDIELSGENIRISEALGRIVKEDIISSIDVPGFRRSTVDGYAVNSKGVRGASESIPAMMNLMGEVIMGKCPSCNIEDIDQCVYVPTGGMLPQGADSMVMLEYTEKMDENTILINKPPAPGDNVIDPWEDMEYGETVIKKGHRLRPYEIGVLASLGICHVNVFKKPKIAIISTGDEIVSADTIPLLGEVRDINTYLLYSLIIESGGEPIVYGIVKDNYKLLRETLYKAIKECDIVLVSGGSSVGKKDHTLDVLESFPNSQVFVHGISIKPGKPTIIGKVENKIVFGLPGHPLACAVILKVVVKSYIDKLMDCKDIELPIECQFSINYHKAKGREEYLPVTIEPNGRSILASPIFGKSGLISVFSKAWGFVKIDKNIEGLIEGQKVKVYKF